MPRPSVDRMASSQRPTCAEAEDEVGCQAVSVQCFAIVFSGDMRFRWQILMQRSTQLRWTAPSITEAFLRREPYVIPPSRRYGRKGYQMRGRSKAALSSQSAPNPCLYTVHQLSFSFLGLAKYRYD